MLVSLVAGNSLAAGKATRVVVIVWDGMRPDFVSEATTPTLFKLAREGVTFNNHHPVFVASTEVNGVALATGVYPEVSGVVGNHEFRPRINAARSVNTEALATVRKGDELTGGRYLAVPTVAEILQGGGRRTVIAGTKPVALLFDRATRTETSLGVNLFEGKILPESLKGKITVALGEFPRTELTKTNRDRWTTSALIGPLWESEVPALSVLWLGEPDYAQHQTGPGSPVSLAAIRSSDDNLARVLAALEKRGLRETTDVIVVSDHAVSTVSDVANVATALDKQGFRTHAEVPTAGLPAGDVLVVGNGGVVLFYVAGAKQSRVEQIVHALQAQPFCGVVFTKKPVAGAFALREVKMHSAAAPDILLALRWSADKSTNGTAGSIYSDSAEYGPGRGAHGTSSPFDLHNVCIAAGPDFRRGYLSQLPSGNVDIAPTILWVFGLKPKTKMSGRVLRETMLPVPALPLTSQKRHLNISWRAENFTWQQYLNFSDVNGVRYLDEGNGHQSPVGSPAGK